MLALVPHQNGVYPELAPTEHEAMTEHASS